MLHMSPGIRAAMALVLLSLSVSGLLGARVAFAENPDNRLQSRIDRLEAGVQAQEAIRAVKRLQQTYSHYLEFGLWPDLAGLFTANAVGQFQTGAITGRENLRKHFMEQAGRASTGLAKGQLNSHLILQPIITLGEDGKTAKGTWHEIAMLGKFGASASWRGGVYENEYVLENGVWKISRLRYFQQYSGAYQEWGHKAPARWDIPYHFEAAHVGATIPQSALQSPTTDSSGVPAAVHLARLSQRVKNLNDETDIQNLQHSYGYYLDRKMWDDVADLFADDGSFAVAQRGTYAGRAHIRRALEVLYGAFPLRKGELFDHLNLATVVTIAPDGLNAGARALQLSMLGLNGEYAQWEEGVYENEFVKQDGIWKIKAVRYYPRMAADYDKGWANDAKPAPAPSKEFPPDRPPAQAYTSYPDIHYVAFHYANPVTGRPVQYPPGAVTRVKIVKQERAALRTKPAAGKVETIDALLTEVERKLDSAIGVDAVENLNSSYGYYIDESAWDRMADTFATTGSKEITGAGVYVGRERIRKVLNLRGPRGGRTPDFFTIHQLTQPVIHISEDGNSAKARLRLFQCGGNSDGSSGSWIGGIYENTAVKENGEWKFGVQDLHHIFNASYRNGWARVGAAARVNAGPSTPRTGRDVPGGGIQQGLGGAVSPMRFVTEFPPDRPIRSKQYAFPEIIEPAFHYKNPVTGRRPAELLP
jgi:hypothetical protein